MTNLTVLLHQLVRSKVFSVVRLTNNNFILKFPKKLFVLFFQPRNILKSKKKVFVKRILKGVIFLQLQECMPMQIEMTK